MTSFGEAFQGRGCLSLTFVILGSFLSLIPHTRLEASLTCTLRNMFSIQLLSPPPGAPPLFLTRIFVITS